jgi:Flp pilus assembly protein TadG
MPVPIIAAGAAAVAARLAAKKLAQEAAKKAAKAAAAKTAKIAKNSVKVKPAAKPKPNKPDAAKTQFKNDSSRTRASDRAMKEYEKNVIRQPGERPKDPSYSSKLGERAALNTKLKRKPNLKAK